MNRKLSAVLTFAVLIGAFYLGTLKNEPSLALGLEIHVTMYHYDQWGSLLDKSHHAGVLTNHGKDWITDKLGGAGSYWGLNGTFIAVSNSTDAPSAAWTVIPAEITTGGLGRATGSYVDTGTGTWNITKTFSISGSNDARLAGLYYNATGNSLICSDTFTPVSVSNGDSLQVVWSNTVS